MAPNLFRSVSKAIAEQFPLLPRIYRSFWGLLLFCLLFMSIGLGGMDKIALIVKPTESSAYFDHQITRYEKSEVLLNGQLVISNPSLAEKILLPNALNNLDQVSLLFLSIISIIMILLVPKLQQQHLFRKDISNFIRLLGYLLLLHGIFIIYRNVQYIPEKVRFITHNQFTSQVSLPVFHFAEMYFALMIIAAAGIYQSGMKLQQEQDLTV